MPGAFPGIFPGGKSNPTFGPGEMNREFERPFLFYEHNDTLALYGTGRTSGRTCDART